jgi:SAM-dependent methyltransferase
MDSDVVKGFFNAPEAVRHYSEAVTRVGLWASEERLLTRLFPVEATILEIGCGAGRVSCGLWELGYQQIMGVDYALGMIKEARRIARALEYAIPFRVADATRLKLGDELFDGALFLFNGLMQIPGRERRRDAMREAARVLRPGGKFVFTSHDRDLLKFRPFWLEEAKVWQRGEQDPLLDQFGDRHFETDHGRTFIHIPTRAEILEDLATAGLEWVEDHLRSELANEPARVREFSEECRFWVAEKPEA